MMIIGGIGYLIAFLKRYQWSAFSFNFVLAAFTYQWSLLVQGRKPRTRAGLYKPGPGYMWISGWRIYFWRKKYREWWNTDDSKWNDAVLGAVSICFYSHQFSSNTWSRVFGGYLFDLILLYLGYRFSFTVHYHGAFRNCFLQGRNPTKACWYFASRL